MKNWILLICFFIFNGTTGQVKRSVTVEWDSYYKIKGQENELKFPKFKGDFYVYDASLGSVYYSEEFSLVSHVNSESLRITNIVLESLSEEELYNIEKRNIPNSIQAEIESVLARGEFIGLFKFSPIIKNSNGFQRVVSLDFVFDYLPNSSVKKFGVQTISNSVLQNGNWYRFYVEKSGVYKLSKSFLNSLGLDTNVDPRTIKIFGNGGRMLPLLNSASYPIDIEENAIQFIGEDDGVFHDSDYILFYAEGVDTWNKESLTSVNLFSDKSYYYVTSSLGPSKRILDAVQPTGTSTLNFDKYDQVIIYEKDLFNVGKIGRRWFGEEFIINNNQTFNFVIPNLDTSIPVGIKVNMASRSFGSTSFAVRVNNIVVGTAGFSSVGNGNQGFENIVNTTFNATNENVSVNLVYNNGGVPSSNGYLDFITLRAKSFLKGFGKQFTFVNNDEATNIGIGMYTLSNASSVSQVWDVTDIFNVAKYSNSNQANFSFKINLGQEKKYVAIDPSDYYEPLKDENSYVQNQNLKGTIFNDFQGNFEDIDYLIICPNFLVSQAERLANFHRSYSNLVVRVVPTELIYQEFGSGKQDIAAIRNFIRYVYWNASIPEKRVRYVNLFGDASFDYKNRIEDNTNIVPVFHGFNPAFGENNTSVNMSLATTFMSDDFFGLMDDTEGPMTNSVDGIDIAVGRMLVSSISQASDMVDKVVQYHSIESYGKWRNTYMIYSDDPDTESDAQLQFELDQLAEDLIAQKPFVNVKKIHTDAYVQQVDAGGERYPEAKNEFLDRIELGSLVVNYLGHGNEESLARERLFEKLDAQLLKNKYRYPLVITITCDFTRFDDPTRFSGGEYLYWNKEGGAISTIATTRLIFVSTGLVMNEYLNEYLYAFGSNQEVTIAEALRLAKLRPGTSSNRRVVFCIGDPALRLAIPKPKVVLTAINDIPVNTFSGSFQALSLMKISGQVVDQNDNLISNYNGDLSVQIFDKDINRSTLGNNGTTNASGLIIMNFTTLGETIFRGNASVNNGLFEMSFVVPKDIRIPLGNGKISFYAKTEQPFLQDQTGYNKDIVVGGVNTSAPEDNNPPKIALYLNDESFVSGSITNCSPILIAFLEDENGINTASGIGHDIVAILDGDEANPIILNDYYETENDDFTKGKVRYPFRDLSPGIHTILFKAWDVYNNLITKEIQFNSVCSEEGLVLENVLNYPNPFVSYTEFWFTHNRPFETLDVQVQILTVTGKLVKTINQQVTTEGFLCRDIKWDGKDDFGDKIGKGVYVYKLTVRPASGGKRAEKYEKLVIL